jgi:hypothetical protein
MTDIAAMVLDHARAGRFDAVREMYAPNLRAMVPVEALRGGPSSPAEYAALQHVDVSIVDEVATWVTRLG